MGLFDSLFGKDPGQEANKQLDNIPGVLQQHLQPYSDQGRQAGAALQGEYGGMMNDPSAFINKMMGQYKPSEGYQFQQDQMGQAAGNSAAAGGQRGGPAEQGEQQKITQGLLGQDMQQWLQNVMGAHTQGMQGEQDIYNKGFQSDNSQAESMMNMYGTKATNDAMSANRPTPLMQGLQTAAGVAGGFMGMPTGMGSSVGGDLVKKWML